MEITVPMGTPTTNPVQDTLKLDKGIIEEGYVYFPLGCVHKVLVRIFHGEFQIAPMNRDEWLRGEGVKVPFGTKYDLTVAPYYLKIYAASPDTLYEHKPLIHVGLNPTYIARPENVIVSQLKSIKNILSEALTGTSEE
jgi:hypothetical protein